MWPRAYVKHTDSTAGLPNAAQRSPLWMPRHEFRAFALVLERRVVEAAPTISPALILIRRHGRRIAGIADAVVVRIDLVSVGDERAVVEAVQLTVLVGVDIRNA